MALSYGLSLNISMVSSIQNQCMLANYIISVERLNQYIHVPSEAPEVIEDNRPPSNWPAVGKVDICDLQVSFTSMFYWCLMKLLIRANILKELKYQTDQI
jgi:hypothetical protein